MNKIQISMSIILIKELYGIGLDMIRTQDNLYSEKTTLLLRIQIISPSAMCSSGVGRSIMKNTMNFTMNMQKLPRLISVAIKKNLWRKEEDNDHGAASMMRKEQIYSLDKSGSDHGFTGEK